MTAVRFGRDHDLLVSIRGGGHGAAGMGICDDGLVIDLSTLRYTEVDPQASTVRVGGGCTWGEVDHATHPFGLAVPSGFVSTTGVGGLTLGGGLVETELTLRLYQPVAPEPFPRQPSRRNNLEACDKPETFCVSSRLRQPY